MDAFSSKRKILVASALVTCGVILVTVLHLPPPSHVSAQIAGSASPHVFIAPQASSPVQILSVTPSTLQAPPGAPAGFAANFRAYDVALRNLTDQDVMVFALEPIGKNLAQITPVADKFTA